MTDPRCSMPVVITSALAVVAAGFLAGYRIAGWLYDTLTQGDSHEP